MQTTMPTGHIKSPFLFVEILETIVLLDEMTKFFWALYKVQEEESSIKRKWSQKIVFWQQMGIYRNC